MNRLLTCRSKCRSFPTPARLSEGWGRRSNELSGCRDSSAHCADRVLASLAFGHRVVGPHPSALMVLELRLAPASRPAASVAERVIFSPLSPRQRSALSRFQTSEVRAHKIGEIALPPTPASFTADCELLTRLAQNLPTFLGVRGD